MTIPISAVCKGVCGPAASATRPIAGKKRSGTFPTGFLVGRWLPIWCRRCWAGKSCRTLGCVTARSARASSSSGRRRTPRRERRGPVPRTRHRRKAGKTSSMGSMRTGRSTFPLCQHAVGTFSPSGPWHSRQATLATSINTHEAGS